MSTPLLIVAPQTLLGLSLITPRKQAARWSLAFAVVGVGAGVTGLTLSAQGKPEAALKADILSIIFSLMSIVKALEVR